MNYVGWLDAQPVCDLLRNLTVGALDMGVGAIASGLHDVAHGRLACTRLLFFSAQLSFLSFAQQHRKFRKSFAKVP